MKKRLFTRISAEYHGISTIMKEWVLIRMSAEHHGIGTINERMGSLTDVSGVSQG